MVSTRITRQALKYRKRDVEVIVGDPGNNGERLYEVIGTQVDKITPKQIKNQNIKELIILQDKKWSKNF